MREEFERVLAQLAVYDRDTIGVQGAVTQLSTHDAALRQRIEELENKLPDTWHSDRPGDERLALAITQWHKALRINQELEQRLAEVTKERDEWKTSNSVLEGVCGRMNAELDIKRTELTETREQVRRLQAEHDEVARRVDRLLAMTAQK